MTRPQTLKVHAELVDRMSGTLGLDLEETMMQGRMQIDTLGDAVLSCTGCTRTQDCMHWMEDNATGAETAPDYCRNRDLFDRIKAGKRA